MPMGAVTLRPGVNTQKTLSANEAGVSISQVIRYKDQMIEAYGGWETYVSFTIPSTVRDLHAWQGQSNDKHLGIGATSNLMVITSGSNQDITPQTNTTNPAPNFSISSGSNVVTVVDGGSSASVFDIVFFNTPVALGGLLLSGAYPILSVGGSSIYTIEASAISSVTIASSGILPIFNTSSGSASVQVTLPNNNYLQITGLFYPFFAPTSVGGITVQGPYQIASIIDSTNFTINAATQATSAATVTMNNGNAQLVYYITLGPQPSGSGFGSGGFGSGGFGTGSAITGAAGTPITADDWTLDNWGQVFVACPKDGPIYVWSPDSGYINAQVIPEAPFFNGGIFVSMPQQILVAWRSCQSTGSQDPLIIRWCNAEDFHNWTVSNQTTAGSFKIPTGSRIVGGIQGPTQGIIWTDIDVWVMQYVGGQVIFNFNRIGSGCGVVGPHAMGILQGIVYWCGVEGFYVLGDKGVQPLPCTVWDFIFQNLDTDNQDKIVCAPNSAFNEIIWFFPSASSAGECDSYVKYNAQEGEWDYGTMPRTAWQDFSILGNPIASDTQGALYSHDTGYATNGVSSPSFKSGWWTITEGNDMAFVDFVIPDFKWGTFSGSQNAQVTMTFYSADYPGGPITTYGPYTITSATQYITPRIRGRLMSVVVTGANSQFWRVGHIRYRFAQAGRR